MVTARFHFVSMKLEELQAAGAFLRRGRLKVKRNLQKSRKISTLHKRGGRILCVFTTK